MKKSMFFILVILLLIPIALAHGEDPFDEAKQLIDSKTSCDQLNDEQLEMIGDYLMEQMHPGEQHENMDNALGGEGSENLKQTHIRIARMMYCGEMGYMMDMGMMQQNNFSTSLTESKFLWFAFGFAVALLISILVTKFMEKPRN